MKLPKKGDLTKCTNWRGIMLLSTASKVRTRIILNRTRDAVEQLLRDNQAGFRPNRSCGDQIATLRIIVEQSLEFNAQLYLRFVDFEKAFDSVDRETMWKLLAHYGIPDKVIRIIQLIYENFEAQVMHTGDLSEPFNMGSGVRQGCLLNPTLFIVTLDWVRRKTKENQRTGIRWTLISQLEDLDFADDVVLLSQNISHMRSKMERIENTAKEVGLNINAGITKEMRIHTKGRARALSSRSEDLEMVDELVYLGSKITKEGGALADISTRVKKATTAFNMPRTVWRSRSLSIKTKQDLQV